MSIAHQTAPIRNLFVNKSSTQSWSFKRFRMFAHQKRIDYPFICQVLPSGTPPVLLSFQNNSRAFIRKITEPSVISGTDGHYFAVGAANLSPSFQQLYASPGAQICSLRARPARNVLHRAARNSFSARLRLSRLFEITRPALHIKETASNIEDADFAAF
jgi:hypothetical protein